MPWPYEGYALDCDPIMVHAAVGNETQPRPMPD
jgi:hypothetical protein